MDDTSELMSVIKSSAAGYGYIPDGLAGWFVSHGFIGHQMCAIMAQHWLIAKACDVPGKDSIRNGYDVVTETGDDIPEQAAKLIKVHDRRMGINRQMREFLQLGRTFGIRIAFFDVRSTDPDYYEKPFNIDGVTPGSYRGIVQVDPYWCSPMLAGRDASQPDTPSFYEPTWWMINGRKYHRSHLIVYRTGNSPDILKPQYLYGGVPIPQKIMERVYAAERTANEAPMLVQTKRTSVWLTDMAMFAAQGDAAAQRMREWTQYRDNYGVKLGDKEGDAFQQFDTALGDLDSVIMTQYQLVAAAADVPATKLLGTSPKGFNATGEYDEASYHETLRSIQEHDLTPLLERHHLLLMRSVIRPQTGVDLLLTVAWRPLDAPTAQELAATNLTKAQTGAALIAAQVISSEDELRRIATDPTSGYKDLGLDRQPAPDDGDIE